MILTFIILLTVSSLILFLVLLKTPISIGMKIGLIISLISLIFCVKFIKGFIPIPIGIRHTLHLMFPPKDLFNPIIEDNFKFYEKEYSKVYKLDAKYIDFYKIGVKFKKDGISSKYKFNGKIKAEFFHKDNLLSEEMITSIKSGVFLDNSMEKYKEFSFLKFTIPLVAKHIRDISVKLTVLNPDPELEKYKDSIKLYIGVSATP